MVLTWSLCVLYGSQNKQRLLPYTELTDWFCIIEAERVYYAVRSKSLSDTRFVFKGLTFMSFSDSLIKYTVNK